MVGYFQNGGGVGRVVVYVVVVCDCFVWLGMRESRWESIHRWLAREFSLHHIKFGVVSDTPTSTTEIITLHGRCRGEKRVPAACAQTMELPFPFPLLKSVWPG